MRILVGTNESAEAAAAILWAGALAEATRAGTIVAEVFEPRVAERSPGSALATRADNARQLDQWVRLNGVPNAELLAIEGDLPSSLISLANTALVDLMVIGSKAYEGVTRLGLGGLAHSLVHHLACPLVVVPEVATSVVGGLLLVADDGSDEARAALHWATTLGWRVGAGVASVRAVGPEAAGSLRDEAEHQNAGLLVVAARARHSLHGHLVGSLPDALLHHPTRPVAVLTHHYQARHRDCPADGAPDDGPPSPVSCRPR